MQHKDELHQERRQGPDIWARLVGWISMAGWLTFIATLVLVQYAKPEMNSGLVRYYNIDIRTEWLPRLSDLIFILLWICSAISIISILVNRRRMRRSSDTHLYNLILLGLLSIVGVLLMFPVVLRVN